MPDVALSTMWGIGRFPILAGFFEAGTDLGFDRFELNHAVDSRMLEGINLDGLGITSVHEPCPTDTSTSLLKKRNWLISAEDEELRRQGVAAVRRSINLAARLGAQVVIVHPGRVDGTEALDADVRHLYESGRAGQPDYSRAKEALIRARAARAPMNMRSVRRSVLELAEHASLLGIKLGLEVRYHYFEIPQPDELEELLTMGLGDTVGYWHDVGHAQTLETLGFATHEEWLRRFSSRIIGVHLHDIVGIQDHRAAGLGTMDWDLVARYLPASALRTCEFHPDNTPEQVRAGLRFLVDKGLVSESEPVPAAERQVR